MSWLDTTGSSNFSLPLVETMLTALQVIAWDLDRQIFLHRGIVLPFPGMHTPHYIVHK